MKIAYFLFAFLLLASPFFIIAQDSDSQETTESQNATEVVEVKLGPSADASTVYVFPNSTNNKFFVGKPISIVVGLNNIGSGTFNVTQVGASLMYPQDHRYYIQNYTKGYYGETVSPSEIRSFLYNFFPDPMLEPRIYGLVISVYYTDLEGGNFSHVVFNNTIELIETDESMDAQTLFLYVGILGIAGLVGFLVYKSARVSKQKKGPRRVEYGTQKAVVLDNDWLAGTSAAQSPKSRSSPKLKPKKNN